MHIAISAGQLSSRSFGIKTYLENLTAALLKEDPSDRFSILKPRGPAGSSFYRNLWEQTALPLMLAALRPDIFHCPDHILPLIPAGCKTVITVHDLAFYRQPKAYSLRKKVFKLAMTPFSIRHADKIIAVSANTKKDIMEYFGCDPAKIEVIHNGVGREFKKIHDEKALKSVKEKYGLSRPFILFVGTIEPRKNILRLIEAFHLMAGRKSIEHDLVIVGKRGWLYQDVFDAAREKGKGRIMILENVTDEELPLVYNSADVFANPSLYEGFGIPPLEAMACGVPVITSNTSSLPEVVGEAAIKVNPYNTGNIADAITQVLTDGRLRHHMIEAGLERAKLFTWEEAAKNTIALYERTVRR